MILNIETGYIGLEKTTSVVPTIHLEIEASKLSRTLNKLNIDSLKQQIEAKKKAEAEKKNEDEGKQAEDQKASAVDDLASLESNLKDAEKNQESLDEEEKIVEECIEFLKSVLKLTDKQVNTVEDNLAGEEHLVTYTSYVISQIKSKGKTKLSDFLAPDENSDKDPKKD